MSSALGLPFAPPPAAILPRASFPPGWTAVEDALRAAAPHVQALANGTLGADRAAHAALAGALAACTRVR